MKFRIFFELVGGVVLVSGQEFTQKMAVDVRLCCDVEGDTRRVAEASYVAEDDIVNKRRSDCRGVQIMKQIRDEVGVG